MATECPSRDREWMAGSLILCLRGQVYTKVVHYRVITRLDELREAVSIDRQIGDEVQGLSHEIICRKEEEEPAKALKKEKPVREGNLGV